MLELLLDLLLIGALLGVAAAALLSGADLFRAVVLFIVFGLLMSLAWMRLAAPDIALAEAAIGAGLTGALLLDAVGQMVGSPPSPGPSGPHPARWGSHPSPNSGRGVDPDAGSEPVPPLPLWERGSGGEGLLAAFAVLALAAVLFLSVRELPQEPGGLTAEAAARLEASGVEHPVTAVLLNYRGYDTWLEVGVLLLAVLAVLILRRAHDLSTVPVAPSDDPLLERVVRWLLPVMLLTGGYLLWLGTSAPGGAFQAGAVLAAAAVLLLLAGERSITALPGGWLRLALTLGFAAFLLLALALLLGGRRLLEYPSGAAGVLILLVETAVTLSIAATLAALFAGARPSAAGAKQERGA